MNGYLEPQDARNFAPGAIVHCGTRSLTRRREVLKMAANRFRDAWYVQQGACNIRGIARSLVEAADAAANEGGCQETDAAVRLIIHQLAFLARIGEIDLDPYVWRRLMDECAEKGGVEDG
jgi:hypothetical protein